MKIPSELINNFVTSEFKDIVRTSTGEIHFNSFYIKDAKKKLYMNPKTGQFICFKSGEQGSILKLVKDYIGLKNNSEALNYLVTNYSLGDSSFEEELEIPKIESDEVIKDFFKKDQPTFFKNVEELGFFGKKAYKYLLDRKIEEEYIDKLGYVFNDKSRYDKRIIIPFYENGQMVYFISRSIDSNEMLRYLNIEKLDSKDYLFNYDNINEDVIICEGAFDAMSITVDQPATCLLSADIGVGQMEKLFEKHVKNIIYVRDNDETGRLHLEKNINKLVTYCPYGLNIYTYDLPKDCKDINDMKIKYGKNYILKKECTKYEKKLFDDNWLKRL